MMVGSVERLQRDFDTVLAGVQAGKFDCGAAGISVDEPAATIRGSNRPIPDNSKRHHADKADICDGVRALTTRERGYIQTFPDTFDFPGAKTDVELAIGNAVPPALAKYVANCIKQYCTE